MTALRKARIEAGLSQAKLAALTGVTQSLISAAENRRLVLYPSGRRNIAKVLGKDEAEIFPSKVLDCYEGSGEERSSGDN